MHQSPSNKVSVILLVLFLAGIALLSSHESHAAKDKKLPSSSERLAPRSRGSVAIDRRGPGGHDLVDDQAIREAGICPFFLEDDGHNDRQETFDNYRDSSGL